METQYIGTIKDTIRNKGKIELYIDKYDNSDTKCLTGIIKGKNKLYDIFTINLEKYNDKTERGDIFIINEPKFNKYAEMLTEQGIIKQVSLHVVNYGQFTCYEYKILKDYNE